jgi:CRISPR/Cas system Type II protein with McrA/HNH and RuvC-like nuclease domain
MKLEEIIESLETESKYWENNPTQFTQGRMFQANKTLEQLRLYAVVGRSEQLKAIEELTDLAQDCCPTERIDYLHSIINRL